MNLNPFIDLIVTVLDLYKTLLLVWIIFSWLIYFDILNLHSKFVRSLEHFFRSLIDPVLSYIRRYLPPLSGLDVSALILFLLIGFLKQILLTYFYKF